jgi:NAD(P)-dependent dehydrogenase (short-subunit alcohol dehydrogenase family)
LTRLAGHNAIVTGASRGLGLAIARALAVEGAHVGCLARPGAELDAAVAALRAGGARATALPADVTRDAEVAEAVRAGAAASGRLDIVVLNAGTWRGAPVHETTEAMWDALLDLNLKGAFLTLRHALPRMTGAAGTVVGIGSIGGLVGAPGSSAYAASKWGLRGLLESVALEVKPRRIRVSIVAPHDINSAGAEIPAGAPERDRRLETADVAGLVAWICTQPPHVSVGNVSIWPIAAGIRGI